MVEPKNSDDRYLKIERQLERRLVKYGPRAFRLVPTAEAQRVIPIRPRGASRG